MAYDAARAHVGTTNRRSLAVISRIGGTRMRAFCIAGLTLFVRPTYFFQPPHPPRFHPGMGWIALGHTTGCLVGGGGCTGTQPPPDPALVTTTGAGTVGSTVCQTTAAGDVSTETVPPMVGATVLHTTESTDDDASRARVGATADQVTEPTEDEALVARLGLSADHATEDMELDASSVSVVAGVVQVTEESDDYADVASVADGVDQNKVSGVEERAVSCVGATALQATLVAVVDTSTGPPGPNTTVTRATTPAR